MPGTCLAFYFGTKDVFCTEGSGGRSMNPLTAEQKSRIHELKREGIGYKNIAKQLCLSVSTVKSFLLRHPIDSVSYCRCCGVQIEQKDKRKRLFCSKKCKDKYWSIKVIKSPEYLKEFSCLECGRSFFDHPSRIRKYCSRLCFQKSKLRKREDTDGKE